MFINYKDTNVHAIPDIKMKTVRLKNKATGKIRTEERADIKQTQTPQDIKWLRPGWNEFPSALWNKVKNHPTHVKMVEDGKIELLAEKVTVKQGKKTVTKVIGQDDEEVTLDLITEKRAVQIIKETYNLQILQRWEDEETRHKVKRAIVEQVKLIHNAGKKKDDE